ncbi:TetR/AcrR family transcriptional regulator [Aquincola sp. S2]|uniref:TetR/AcrR family transcriptional regulator n=1 Tax=Pseudaquabacterium terrae TaxID=2732868 RepID=A0ABX2ET41_9BURK|nr:TetR/AcrR family transcriptional regulator [Aquabacterium terrae]NRF71651.1 TetR/AcrR family transcriptional regulator [Aquabacterium terrae]
MRYSATHKQETREKLINTSREIAKKDGFGGTGVDAFMKAIGLTGGAFYTHFESKAELFAELVEHELEFSTEMLAGDEDAPADHVARKLRSYLSSAHALHPETGCVLPTLGPEIARASPEVKARVEKSLKRLRDAWSERLDDDDAGWALLAQCVGALILARVVESERTRREILGASRRFLERAEKAPRK